MNKSYKKVLKAIEKYDTIVILRHEVPDFDASGSQFGLVTWIKDNYPKKKVFAVGKPHKLFSPNLYPESEINVDVSNCKYLCIVLDVANTPRIDGKEYLDNADFIIKIDHHPLTDEFGNISIVDDTASAAAEIIGEMLLSFNKKLSQTTAFYLYSAIVGDSGCFQYSSTSERTMLVASKLLKTKFDFRLMFEKMFIKSIDDLNVIKFIYDRYQITENGVAYYIISNDDLVKLNIVREKVKAFVNLFSGYNEIKVWVQFTEDITAEDEYRWRVSIRSRGVKINDIAAKYHGGGHDNASGAKCVDKDEMLRLVNELDEFLK